MNARIHDRIESLAGAIALGEATDAERQEYRSHIASCAHCLQQLGGEREIERTVAVVTEARSSEVWQPDLTDAVAVRMQRRARRLRFTFGVAGLCLCASFGLHVLFFGGLAGLMPKNPQPAVINLGPTRITLEQRPSLAQAAQDAPPPPTVPRRTYVAQHNVVIMQRAIATPAPAPALKPAPAQEHEIASMIVHPEADYTKAKPRNVPSWHTVATTTTTSLTETAPQSFKAESMQFGPVKPSREASPIGGETAIDPKPPMIAYDEGAEGTSAFEVLVDERGNPTKCVITKTSGFAVLDDSVCKAAMSTKYTPKVQDGRAVAGVYRDAFTFRMQEDPSDEGLPQGAHIPSSGAAHTPSPGNASNPGNPGGAPRTPR